MRWGEAIESFRQRLFAPRDIASLVLFRIVFGLFMAYEMLWLFGSRNLDKHWIEPQIHFKYFGFEWIPVPPDNGILLLVGVIALCGLGFAFGALYRLCATLIFIGFTWLFLMDSTNYNHHYCLNILLSFLSIFLPANRSFSIDAHFRPKIRAEVAPAWCLWIVLFQIGVVYFYGGIAKINSDWLQGEPMRMWLNDLIRGSEFLVYAFSYGGLAFDLLIVPLLLWRKTQILAFFLALSFHLVNSALFMIATFPWFAIASTTLFLPADFHRRLLGLAGWGKAGSERGPSGSCPFRYSTLTTCAIGLWVLIQVTVPLRHFLYPGNVAWTHEGYYFAWHMKLSNKFGGFAFVVQDPATKQIFGVDTLDYLSPKQRAKIAQSPESILQFAHYLAEEYKSRGVADPKVYAQVIVRLNRRYPQLVIDPKTDLAKIKTSLKPADWILPLTDNPPPIADFGKRQIKATEVRSDLGMMD